jgi:NADH-quinone oxidoreductase subunit J
MFLFIIFALIAVVAAIGVVVSRKPVYSALFLLMNFATLAAMYITLQAQFLAAVQVIMYAGAIVVLFLFVVMLIGGGELKDIRDQSKPLSQQFTWPRLLGIVLAASLLATLAWEIATGGLNPAQPAATAQGSAAAFGQGSVEAIGNVLYTDYLLPFELTSVLLLVGMIGAVVLARPSD